MSDIVLDQLDGFLNRWLGKFVLTGKIKSVEVYELICKVESASEKQNSICRIFASGINAYQQQSWRDAIDYFNGALEMDHTDGPSLFYRTLAEKYQADPPAADWDGTVNLNKN